MLNKGCNLALKNKVKKVQSQKGSSYKIKLNRNKFNNVKERNNK